MQATRKARVIIVDDDRDVRESLTAVVLALGHESVVFGAAEPVLAFDELPECDVMLVDNDLPGISGTELVSELRRRAAEPPACLYTGKADARLRDVALGLENTTLLEKGYDTHAISNYLMKTLAGPGGANAPESIEGPL